jgi:6-phosphofructokinase 1
MTGFVITSGRDASSGERGDRGYRSIVITTQLDGVSLEARTLNAEHLGAGGTQVSEEFTDWARPLVGGALPEYISLV